MIALPQFRGMAGGGFDPLTNAFATASGATDLGGIDAIIKYVRSQGLLSNFRLYPKKSAQNAGSGSTLYGIGSLTANNGTLHNGPSWGTGGITFDTTDDYASIPDFLGSETLTVGVRRSGIPADGGHVLTQWNYGASTRSWRLFEGTQVDTLAIGRSADGSSTNDVPGVESYQSEPNEWPAADTSIVAQWVNGGDRSLWLNTSAVSLTFLGGTPQTARFNASDPIFINAASNAGTPSLFAGGVYIATWVLAGVTPTQTQRETITNLINAL